MVPTSSYIICTTPRSGSNLLSTTLWQTGIAGRPKEHFVVGYSDEFLQYNWLGVRNYRDYIRAVIDASTTPNGVLGISLHAVQTRLFLERVGHSEGRKVTSLREGIETVFPNPQYIFLTRNDKVAQAISHYRACMTGEWRRFDDSIPESDKTLVFNQYGIKKSLQTLEKSDDYWERFFEEHGIAPLRLTYEDIVGDYDAVIRRVLKFLGLPSDIAIPLPVTKKISDERSRMWAEEFLLLERNDPIVLAPSKRFGAPF